MSREIRVTIDDDEVFERMKYRKQQLDLSWEEVLRRGLHHSPEHDGIDHGRPSHQRREEERHGQGYRHGDDQLNSLGADISRHVQAHVANTLRNSMQGILEEDSGGAIPGPSGAVRFDRELGSLERAENATLEFPFLDAEPANQIPLRVDLRTGADGLDVDVVTIRRGKNVSGTNQYTPETRKTITKHLARGEDAVLQLAAGDEIYRVIPTLSWSRDSTGQPTVTELEITQVLFD